MFSNSIKRALVVASVALALPVLSGGAAYADNDKANAHSNKDNKSTSAATSSESSEHGKSNEKKADKADSSSSTDSASKGKGNETDKSGSSTNSDGTFQGKSSSTPDQDGKGMDRGADNNDKTGPGTDGNNGCGNEPRLAAPRDGGRPTDDDNNGWCGSKPKPVKSIAQTPAKQDRVKAPKAPKTAPAPKAVPVRGTTAAPVKVVANGTVTPLVVGSVVQGAKGTVRVAGPVARTVADRAVAGTVVAAATAAPTALPFTGAPVGTLLVLAGLILGFGALLTIAGSRRTA